MSRVTNTIKFSLSLLMFLSTLSYADDIDIFEVEKPPVPPNVLFVLDGSGSMDSKVSGTKKTRMEVMQGALNDLITSKDPATGEYNTKDINIGLMSFSNRVKKISFDPYDISWLVHGPAFPVTPIDDPAQSVMASNPLFPVADFSNSYLPAASVNDSARSYAPKIINQWDTGSGTPIVGALFEAAKYMRGEDVYWGNKPPNKIQAAHPSTYDGLFLANGSTNNSTNMTTTEPCGGVGQPVCNKQKSCTTSTSTTAPVVSDTPIAGQDCTAIPYTKTCAVGETFCGDAQDAASCTTIPGTTTFTHGTCAESDIFACFALGYSSCLYEDGALCDEGDTAAECLIKHPTWTACIESQIPGLFHCRVPLPEIPPNNPRTCFKPLTADDTVTCPATKYSCTLTTTTETCTHVVTNTIISSGVSYKSPIKKECQSNAIILLSDGGPTVSNSAELVSNMIGPSFSQNASGLDCKDTPKPSDPYDWGAAENINYYGRCGTELARFLAQTDNSATVNDDQPVNLYTIGFALGADSLEQKYMEDLAKAGGGEFYPADNAADLIAAFKDAITSSNAARQFSPPALTPHPTSLLSHGEIVYLPIFSQDRSVAWSGNLKKFKIHNGSLTEADLSKNVMDSTGRIRKDVVDMWATGTLEHPVKSGGAASQLDPSSRNIKTDNGNGSLVALNASNVTKAQLTPDNNPVISNAERIELIEYIKGWDDQYKPRHHMGDIIHSKPVVVDYPNLNNRRVIFVGTNEGFLHAINDSDGSEAFAYMPSELLDNIKLQKDNSSNVTHPYGVDGEITVWKGKVNATDTSEKTMLFFGLRRGGKAYYALDVTNPDAPELRWKITPTVNGDFDKLGYTWSKPKVAKVKVNQSDTKPTNVLIFGGGYVDDHGLEPGHKDAQGNPVAEADNSGTGADVYIVDMDDGSKLWNAAAPGNNVTIDYAIPANVRELDLDGNGLLDHMYFADTGGKVWRVDIIGSLQDVKVYPFAELGVSTPKRKFFTEPDVAFFKHAGRFVNSIAIGSGDRPNPLDNNNQDAMFVLLDKHPLPYHSTETPDKPVAITTSDLKTISDVSTGLNKSIFSSVNKDKKGWYYPLAVGEKILTPALTFQNKIIFTSFAVDNASAAPVDPCVQDSKTGSYFYALDLYNAKSVINPPSKSWGPGIKEVPMPYYPDIPSGGCVDAHCERVPEFLTPEGSAPVKLPNAFKKIPRVYWMNQG